MIYNNKTTAFINCGSSKQSSPYPANKFYKGRIFNYYNNLMEKYFESHYIMTLGYFFPVHKNYIIHPYPEVTLKKYGIPPFITKFIEGKYYKKYQLENKKTYSIKEMLERYEKGELSETKKKIVDKRIKRIEEYYFYNDEYEEVHNKYFFKNIPEHYENIYLFINKGTYERIYPYIKDDKRFIYYEDEIKKSNITFPKITGYFGYDKKIECIDKNFTNIFTRGLI